jgi:Asp-tRNA(Asn)/Glu-tRNA(Gln) amidotransferase A subunit family amidase
MAEAKGINPGITPEEVTEEVKEMATEVKEEVKEATAEVVEKVLPMKGQQQLVSLRETVSSEGFDDKRGWRRIMALWGSTNSPFYR